jgi:hypothetical protein
VLRIKDKVVTKSKYVSVNTSTLDGVTLDFMQSFEFRVFNQPEKLSVEIVHNKGGIFDQQEIFGGMTLVRMPGRALGRVDAFKRKLLSSDSASGYAPVAGWYHFSEAKSVNPRKKDLTVFNMMVKVSDKSPTEVRLRA